MFRSIYSRAKLIGLLGSVAGALALAAPAAHAKTWYMDVGAQSHDAARQAMAFLPNEIWVNAGDSITWTSRAGEGHTVTFVPSSQTRPGFGFPGTADPSSFNNTAPANSDTLCDGSLQQTNECAGAKSFTVQFPTAGNFVFVCLIHPDMTGTVHVLPSGASLPHDQKYYDALAVSEKHDILAEDGSDPSTFVRRLANAKNEVITTGEVVATGGGKQYLTIMRFLPSTIYVHKGETVEWTNVDPTEPHTITFVGPSATEPMNPFAPVNAVPTDTDGSFHGTLTNSDPSYLYNAFISSAAQYQSGQLQSIPSTRARVTFTKEGTYDYFCALHDELGMKGRVVVIP